MTNDRFDQSQAFDAQERALRHGDDARWTQVAQALRQPPSMAPLPGNFACEVARLARQQAAAVVAAHPAAEPDMRLERWLVNALGIAMAVAALVMIALYGGQWFRGTGMAVLAGLAGHAWLGVLVACLGLHAVFMAVSRWPRDGRGRLQR